MKKNGDCKIKRLELSGKGVSQGRLTRWADGDERKGNGWKERGMQSPMRRRNNQSCPASTIRTTRSVSLSTPFGWYAFLRLAPKSHAKA